jgi:predicted DNA-binding helix-hairpin-helix protein
LRLEDVKRLSGGLKRARAFLVAADHTPGSLTDSATCGRDWSRRPSN